MLPRDELGEGDAVILLHAGVADRSMWGDYLPPLAAAGHRVMALDLPGYGEAPVADLDEPWADVLETMDALGIESAALVGNSFGAAIAQRVAVAAPARVTSLVLISGPAPGVEPSPELIAAWDAEDAALEAGDVDAAVRAVVEAWTLEDAPEELRERVAAMQRRAFELQDGADPGPAEDPVGEDPVTLAGIDVPVLIVAGGLDMSDFLQAAQVLAGVLQRSRSVVLPGAGHLVPLEAPEALTELLVEFLA